MPSYHCSVKPVQRSNGRSSTAAAAYRAGCNIEDERTGITHDYSRKTGVVDSGMVGWSGSRSELWNAAEQAERRKDATTAREYEIALPRELNREQQTALTRDYATWINERHGCAVDWSMHRPDAREYGNDNPHAHLLTTTRTVDQEGHALGGKCDRELSDTKRETKGLGPRREDLSEAREVWASIQNQHLERAGISERVDHRSNAERNMDAEPHVHTGPKATAMERRGEHTERGDLNRQILELNRQRVETLRELKQLHTENRQLQAESKNLTTEEKAAFGQMQQEKRIEKTVDTARQTADQVHADRVQKSDQHYQKQVDAAKERVSQAQANRTTANENSHNVKGQKIAHDRLNNASRWEHEAEQRQRSPEARLKDAEQQGQKATGKIEADKPRKRFWQSKASHETKLQAWEQQRDEQQRKNEALKERAAPTREKSEDIAQGRTAQEHKVKKDTIKERFGTDNAQITKDAEQKHAALKEQLKSIEDGKKGVQGEITDRQSRLDRLQKQLDEAKERKNQLDPKGTQTKEVEGMTRKERLEQTLKEKQQQQGQGQERGGENAELGRKERLEQTLKEKQEQKPQEAGKEDKGRKGKDEDMSL